MPGLDEIRARIRRRLLEMDRSQERASLAMGFSKDALNKFLTRPEATMSPRMARAVAQYCGWSEAEILEQAGHLTPSRTGDPVRDALVVIEGLPVLPDDRMVLRHMVETFVDRARLLATNGKSARRGAKDNGIGGFYANYGILTRTN